MKVVITTGIFPPDVGGPATSVPTLASSWAERGWAVEVVTYSDRLDDAMVRPYAVHRVSRRAPLLNRYAAYFAQVWRAAEGANVLFAQDPIAAGAPAWLVSWLRGKRFVLKLVGDFAWEHARVQAGFSNSLEAFQDAQDLPLRFRMMRWAERFVARRADRVIVPSRFLADIAERWGVDPSRIAVVYNGVAPVSVHTVRKVPQRIVTSARLVSWKGIDTLIAALSKVRVLYPDASLLVIGDGPDEARLKAQVQALKLDDHVTFVGRRSRQEVEMFIAESAVFALVSSYEGFSHQLVEAFQLGAATVASAVGGNPELVKHGENGLLVPAGDVEATAAALSAFLGDPAFAARCGAAAKRRAGDFTVGKQMHEMSEAVRGADRLRALIISRDASLLDADSRGAARMRMYGERVESLRVLSLARRVGSGELSPRVHARLVSVQGWGMTLLPAIRAALQEAKASQATIVISQDPFEAGIVAWVVAWLLRLPLVVEEHGGVYLENYWRIESLRHECLAVIGRRIMAASSGIRAVSAKIAHDVQARYHGKPVARISVFTEAMICVPGEKRFAFGYVGRFVPQKNLPMLLEAFRDVVTTHPDLKLAMVGKGPLEDELKNLSMRLGIGQQVEWLPFREDIASVYGSIGTLVLPSWYEGWGRVVVEAMHCGVPVIMTDVGAAGEVVRDGIEGRVTPIGDRAAFAEAMIELALPERHAAMAQAAKTRASMVETPETITTRLIAFWNNIVGL